MEFLATGIVTHLIGSQNIVVLLLLVQVLDQFLATSINESSELTESYLVGNRLVKFLSVVLPTHQDYFSTDGNLAALRNRSQAQLVELLQYMEELAMLIDEIEYSK